MVLIVAGAAASAFSAHVVAANNAQASRAAFRATSAEIASNVKLSIQSEQELTLAAAAFAVGNPHATESQFSAWGRQIQVIARYPEIQEIGWAVKVPAAQLSAYARRIDPGLSASRSKFTVFPAGDRPYYCLTKFVLARAPKFLIPGGTDLCALNARVTLSEYTGVSYAAAATLPHTAPLLGIVNPVYRGGGVPATQAARNRAFLGWTGIDITPSVLLATARRGHAGIPVALRLTFGASTLVFRSGRAPRGAQTDTINLHDGSTVRTFGLVASPSIFASAAALAVLIGGIAMSALLALLVLVLASGRARALRMVREKTRELSDEAVLLGLARDEAVEASNAKTVFVATVSHELRTPLAGLIGTSELLLDTELTPEQREYGEIVRSSSEGLLVVLNDILDFSKIEAGKLQLETTTFALREVIAEACSMQLPAARNKGIALDVDTDTSLPEWLLGDPGRLRQVVINLLSNAVKFTSQGQIIVRARASATADATLVRVDVTDTGIGIDEATLARVFQAFTQADSSTARKYGGTGLGLAICAQLIEMMGGEMGALSTPGKGSTFWFEVPLAVAEPSDHVTVSSPKFGALGERDAAGNLTDAAPLILVAEDNPVNQMIAGRLLDKCGYRSELAASGVEAVAATGRGSYAAVLMDCQMPEMDGYEATREIRRREAGGAHLPIIATTAQSMAGDAEKCLAAGMDAYIAKPIRASELRDALAHVLSPRLAPAVAPASGRS